MLDSFQAFNVLAGPAVAQPALAVPSVWESTRAAPRSPRDSALPERARFSPGSFCETLQIWGHRVKGLLCRRRGGAGPPRL